LRDRDRQREDEGSRTASTSDCGGGKTPDIDRRDETTAIGNDVATGADIRGTRKPSDRSFFNCEGEWRAIRNKDANNYVIEIPV
jgi:hypothetical protein